MHNIDNPFACAKFKGNTQHILITPLGIAYSQATFVKVEAPKFSRSLIFTKPLSRHPLIMTYNISCISITSVLYL